MDWLLLLGAYVACLLILLRPPELETAVDQDTFRWAVVLALACIAFFVAFAALRR